jgi:hypothetical protein
VDELEKKTPDDLKTAWNFGKDTENLLERTGSSDISQIRGADGTP